MRLIGDVRRVKLPTGLSYCPSTDEYDVECCGAIHVLAVIGGGCHGLDSRAIVVLSTRSRRLVSHGYCGLEFCLWWGHACSVVCAGQSRCATRPSYPGSTCGSSADGWCCRVVRRLLLLLRMLPVAVDLLLLLLLGGCW